MMYKEYGMDEEYGKAFHDGYIYVLIEIERWIKKHEKNPKITQPVENLLKHLKLETE